METGREREKPISNVRVREREREREGEREKSGERGEI